MTELSVIMATYNESIRLLKTCVESVLRQTFNDFEFIIAVEPGESNIAFLDDVASSDKRIKIIRNSARLGVAGSRNSAILESSGKYIALIDGDDYCDLKRFEKQISFLSDNSEVSVVGSNMILIDENDKVVGERKYPEMHHSIKSQFLLTMGIANPTVMLRKNDFDDVGLFDSGLYKAEDFELWLRFLARNKKMHNLQENLVYYRVPATHNERRGSTHWKNNYNARKRYSKLIWPFHQRIFSMLVFSAISHIPENSLDSLKNIRLVNRLKNIKTH